MATKCQILLFLVVAPSSVHRQDSSVGRALVYRSDVPGSNHRAQWLLWIITQPLFHCRAYISQHFNWIWVRPAESPAASGTWDTWLMDFLISLFLTFLVLTSIKPSMRDLIPQIAGALSGHFAIGPHSPRPWSFGTPAWDKMAPDLQMASKLVAPTSSTAEIWRIAPRYYCTINVMKPTPAFPRLWFEPDTIYEVSFSLTFHMFSPFSSDTFITHRLRVIWTQESDGIERRVIPALICAQQLSFNFNTKLNRLILDGKQSVRWNFKPKSEIQASTVRALY